MSKNKIEAQVHDLSQVLQEKDELYKNIIAKNSYIDAYHFLLEYGHPNPKELFDLILSSNDPRLMYETALNIDGAPVDLLYRKVVDIKNIYFIKLFESDIL